MKLKLSIIVPVYNAATFLPRFLSCFENLKDAEVIFVDDCSTDGSLRILEEAATLHPSLSVHHLSRNLGVSVARQTGLDAAQGEYVIFADPDDFIDEGMYEGLIKTAEESGADFVWEDFYEGEDNSWTRRNCRVVDATGEGLICAILTGKLHGATWNKLIRRSFITTCGAKFLSGYVGLCEDVDFLCQVLMANPRCVYHEGCHYRYRVVEGSATHTKREQQMKSLKIVERHLEKVLTTPRTRSVLRLWKFGNYASSQSGLWGKVMHAIYYVWRSKKLR